MENFLKSMQIKRLDENFNQALKIFAFSILKVLANEQNLT